MESEEALEHLEKLLNALEDLDKKKAEEKLHPSPSDKPGDLRDTLVACHDLCGCKRDSTEVAKVMLGVGEEEGPKEEIQAEKPLENVDESKEMKKETTKSSWIRYAIRECHLALAGLEPTRGESAYGHIRNCLIFLEQVYLNEQEKK